MIAGLVVADAPFFVRWCSTPFGVVDDRRALKGYGNAIVPQCSTPFGVVDDRRPNRSTFVTASLVCSTPFGVVDDRSHKVPPRDVALKPVLNAVWRRG